MSQSFDIAIIGGGIVGASIAYFLSPHREVVLLEQEEAMGYHATGRSAAEFSHRFHSDIAGAMTSASAKFMFAPPEGFTDVELLRRQGNLLIANADKDARLKHVFAVESQLELSAGRSAIEMLSVNQAIDLVPFLDPEYLRSAFYDPDCFEIEVNSLLQGYLKGAKAQGAVLQRNARLIGAGFAAGKWQLNTQIGDITATTVINAAGAWADPVSKLLGAKPAGVTPYRRTAINIAVPGYDLHAMPEVNEIDEDFYFKPDAGQLFVSPADETPCEPHDAWPEDLDIAIAADYLDQCTTLTIERVAHSWAGLRSFCADRVPVIGKIESAPNCVLAVGLGGFGVQTSACTGQLVQAVICNDSINSYPSELAKIATTLAPARLGV